MYVARNMNFHKYIIVIIIITVQEYCHVLEFTYSRVNVRTSEIYRQPFDIE